MDSNNKPACAYCSPSHPHVSPPSPPNPSADEGVIPSIRSPDRYAPSPPANAEWLVEDVLPDTAMKILCRSVEALARATGNVPPTPPLSRPTTPYSSPENRHHHRRTSSRPATPISSDDLRKQPQTIQNFKIDSPEACMSEPSTRVVGANAEPVHVQQAAIARKFYSKRAPPVSLEAYVTRLQRFCPMSTAVWLAAGCYIHKLAIEDRVVSVTDRTMHRLVLASLRVAMKALEDLRYPQERFAGVGGVGSEELKLLEISVCYLTNFDLQVSNDMLYEKTVALQRVAQQMQMLNRPLPSTFQPYIPTRTKRQNIVPDGIVA